MDIVFIKDLRIAVVIGVFDWERQAPREIGIDLEIALKSNQGQLRRDNVEDTVDYADVVARLFQELPRQRFALVERLAEFIAELLLKEYETPWVRVRVSKPNILPYVAEVGVTIERGHEI
ncbi:MAG: dihydroneopterin aldolase [Proteobacteria bacterium]|nr:dihydroneopterin aldolase [Pseudomonadota bacterium]MDE3208162.1 dihydroneopterin aldolase [Pseudomonadota bacterium]